MRVSVVGGGTITNGQERTAVAVGKALAANGHTVVCGGLGGTMEAVCRGANSEGGETIGILPTDRRADANEYVDTAVATGLGHARNALVPMNGDAVLALAGSAGTLSEIGLAQVYDRPIVGIDTHEVPGIKVVETPEAAVAALEAAVR
ncbi:Rossmann fold nucleotide-binding protein [Halostagnicola sp. A56]|uniref:TIGR00725 family protein n=1 Tax=Halostagnicola sp. A56 TaxID=1495067 RepID=UPI0004A09892|nr:TIGR00725 family protein [Halostagnicola sp. A56]KDE59739.1 Rossmann fold nucleotide-binding protein [Halostagnicola sp. A56]